MHPRPHPEARLAPGSSAVRRDSRAPSALEESGWWLRDTQSQGLQAPRGHKPVYLPGAWHTAGAQDVPKGKSAIGVRSSYPTTSRQQPERPWGGRPRLAGGSSRFCLRRTRTSPSAPGSGHREGPQLSGPGGTLGETGSGCYRAQVSPDEGAGFPSRPHLSPLAGSERGVCGGWAGKPRKPGTRFRTWQSSQSGRNTRTTPMQRDRACRGRVGVGDACTCCSVWLGT